MSLSPSPPPRAYEFLSFRLDPRARTLARSGEPVTLTPKVFDTLLLLVQNSGQVVTKETALQTIWPDTVVEEANLSQNIFLLRKLLGEKESGQKIILTRTGVGYSFLPEVTEIADVPPGLKHPSAPKRRWLVPTLATAVVLALGATATLSRKPSVPPSHKWAVSTRPGVESFPAVSPDGSRLAFTWDGGTPSAQPALYLQDLPAHNAPLVTPKRLTDGSTGGASSPAWSPDGQQIVLLKEGAQSAAVYLISSDGTGERKIRDLRPVALAYSGSRVAFSPDGRSLAIVSAASDLRPNLIRVALDTGVEESLVPAPGGDHSGDDNPVYSPDGLHLAFVRREFRGSMDVFVAPTSAAGRLTGEPRRLTQQRLPIQGLAWAPDSQSVVFSATRFGTVALWRSMIDGSPPEQVAGGDQGQFPTISRTGGVLSFAIHNESIGFWRLPLSPAGLPAGQPSQLLASTRRDEGPVFSRDGRMLSFFSDRTGSYEIWTSDATGNSPRALTSFGGAFAGLTDWSPDGRTILLDVVTPNSSQDIYAVPTAGGKAQPVITGPAREATPLFSRDGRWIYFSSTRSGMFQLWRTDIDGRHPTQLTKGGGLRPQEPGDGYLYYANQADTPELRRIPLAGGEEETVLTNPRPRFFGHWAICGRRIYLIGQPLGSTNGGRLPLELWLHDLSDRTSRKLTDLPGVPLRTPSLAVSPDGSSLVYSRVDSASGDLYVINGFR